MNASHAGPYPMIDTVVVRRIPPVIAPPRQHARAENPARSAAALEADRILPRLRRLVFMLDLAWGIPGTKIRFGMDTLIGFIPVVGDLAMLVTSLTLVFYALRWKLPFHVIAAMIAYCLIDLGIGVVPVVGDVGDTFFKANLYNFRLLERHRPH